MATLRSLSQFLNKTPTVVTLCGSTRFKTEYEETNKRLSLRGQIVLTCGLFAHADNLELSESQKELLDDLHKRKILLSDYIYVINVGGYVGQSTRSEIEFAERHGIPVYYHEKVKDNAPIADRN